MYSLFNDLFGKKKAVKYYPLEEIKIYDHDKLPNNGIAIKRDTNAHLTIEEWLRDPKMKNNCIWVNRVYKYRNDDINEYYQEYLFINYLDM